MSLAALKALVVKRGVKKKGYSWDHTCPSFGKKEDIIAELQRPADAKRPKARGFGWLPSTVQQLEDKRKL